MRTWWSKSKRRWLVVADMNDFHLRAAFQKLERGEYRIPIEPDDDTDSRLLTATERAALRETFLVEFTKRGLDAEGNIPQPAQDEGTA